MSADEPIELSAKFSIDPSAIKPGLVEFFKREPSIRKSQIIVMMFGLCGGVALSLFGGVEAYSIAAVSFAACICLAFAQPWVQAWTVASALKAFRSAPGAGEQSIEVTATTLTTSLPDASANYLLSSIQSIEWGEGFAVVRIKPMQFLFVPATADFGRETFDTFVEKLKALHSAARKAEPS
jgi:hypothetical protein